MHGKTALLTLALGLALAVPAAAAGPAPEVRSSAEAEVAVPAAATLDEAGAKVLSDAAALEDPLTADPLALPLASGLVDDSVGVALGAEARAGTQGTSVGLSSSAAGGPPSFGERAAAVAVPVAGAGLVAVTLGALAFGVDGLRAFAGRALRGVGSLVGALPLFSRIERGGALDNPVRARVHDAIAQEPGLSLSDVAQRAGIAWGTAVHHLRRLESLGLVVSTSGLGHRRFFIANTPAAAQRSAVVAVMHPTARRIAEYVTQRPGTDQAGLCQALGLNNPAASKHLGQFESRGLVLSQRSGRSRLYHATGGLHSALRLLGPSPDAGAAVIDARPMLVAAGAT